MDSEGGRGSTRLTHFTDGNSTSEEHILTHVEEARLAAKMDQNWRTSEVQIQRDAEDAMIMQSHTPALPPPRPSKRI